MAIMMGMWHNYAIEMLTYLCQGEGDLLCHVKGPTYGEDDIILEIVA